MVEFAYLPAQPKLALLISDITGLYRRATRLARRAGRAALRRQLSKVLEQNRLGLEIKPELALFSSWHLTLLYRGVPRYMRPGRFIYVKVADPVNLKCYRI